AKPYINALKNTPSKNDEKPPTTVSPNLIDVLKIVQERLDNIKNKLITINDKIVFIKNNLIEHQKNKEDIRFRFNRLESMHNIEYDIKHATDPNYVFPSHDDYF
ncbi:8335_t:CDS:1, partial [Funneliformis geosporum]